MSDDKTQLGKILLKRKLVNASELNTLLEEQASEISGERLASRVLKKGLTDEVRLLQALSEQAGVPALNLDELEIDLSNLDLVPKDIAEQYAIMPAQVTDDAINLAMANPDDQQVIDEIGFVTGKRVFPHVALQAQIAEFVEACYSAREAGETVYRGKRFGQPPKDPSRPPAEPNSVGRVLPSNSPDPARGSFSIDVEFPLDEMSEPAPATNVEISEPRAIPDFPADPAAGGTAGPKRRILVVDDEDDIRLLISRVLTEKGYQVITAGRGLEAIQKVQTENPDMIILDAMLPEVHGFDICKKIKGSKKYGHIPVIMISAIYRGWRYAQDLKDSYGVDDFIEKPFKIGDFIERVETHLDSSAAAERPSAEDLSGEAERVLNRALEAYQGGNVDRAVELLKAGLTIDPLAFKLHYNLALLLGKKGLSYQAIRELENALELAPEYFPALKNLALLYQQAGFKFKSIETWERALHYCPDDKTRDGIKQHLMSLL